MFNLYLFDFNKSKNYDIGINLKRIKMKISDMVNKNNFRQRNSLKNYNNNNYF